MKAAVPADRFALEVTLHHLAPAPSTVAPLAQVTATVLVLPTILRAERPFSLSASQRTRRGLVHRICCRWVVVVVRLQLRVLFVWLPASQSQLHINHSIERTPLGLGLIPFLLSAGPQ